MAQNLPFPDGFVIRASFGDYDDAGDLKGILVQASSFVDFEPVIEHYLNLPDWNMTDPQDLYDMIEEVSEITSLVGDNDGWSAILMLSIVEPGMLVYEGIGMTPGETVVIAALYKPAPEELYPEAYR